MKEQIVFIDWDGTLCNKRLWHSLYVNDPSTMDRIQSILFDQDRTRVNRWMRGDVTAEEMHAWLAPQLQIETADLWKIFVHDCATFEPWIDLDLIQPIRARAHVALATDNMDSFIRFTVPALGLEQRFDDILCSSQLGFMKKERDGEWFTRYVREKNLDMSRAYLLDDSPGTCELFTRLGGHAMLVTGHDDVTNRLGQWAFEGKEHDPQTH